MVDRQLSVACFGTRDADFEARFQRLEARREVRAHEIDEVVSGILEDVRRRGDDALLDAVQRFDGYRLTPEQIQLSAEEIQRGPSELDSADRAALELAAARIRSFHRQQRPAGSDQDRGGERLGLRVRPLARVGLYVPGIQAPLASTVLMLGIPARVAGVPELVMVSPGRHTHAAVRTAAGLAEVTRLLRIGGAQAVAALAFGTESVPRVDKIVGPGNAYVQAAKRQVFGQVAIDAEAGASEVFVVADDSAPAPLVAADLLAQAEHDEMASVVLATPSGRVLEGTRAELARQLSGLPREKVARLSLREHGALILTRSLEEAIELANRFAAEHLQLMVQEPRSWLESVESAGAVFLGVRSTVPLGDYVAGPSHVLPTGGTARFFSVLGVEDFVKRMSVIEIGESVLQEIGPSAVRLAELEGLEAHARAIRLRLAKRPGGPAGQLDPGG